MGKAKPRNWIVDRWLIESIEQWDRDFIDEEVRGYFEFDAKDSGDFQFGYVQGQIDYRLGERDGKPAVEFTWDGHDEMEAAQGRGWLLLEGDELKGRLFFHLGDDSGIVLKRAPEREGEAKEPEVTSGGTPMQGGTPMPKKQRASSPVARFKVGDKVRVKVGIRDTDYPDIPLGGWTGTISEVHRNGTYTIQWSPETLAAIHPVVKRRSEKDGTVLEEYWLADDDLEPDPGGPLNIEQPTEITTKPLTPKDQDDRIRMVFGLTSNDPVPEVNDETLAAYRDYLTKNLTFPFQAEHGGEYGHSERVKVIGFEDPDGEPMIDETYDILCEARIEGQVATVPLGELEDAKPNRQLIDDYCYWLHNWA